jgi:hypothetical protein
MTTVDIGVSHGVTSLGRRQAHAAGLGDRRGDAEPFGSDRGQSDTRDGHREAGHNESRHAQSHVLIVSVTAISNALKVR